MDERDAFKAEAINLVTEGKDATEIWGKFRKLRNEINNRRKFEEINFKKERSESRVSSKYLANN